MEKKAEWGDGDQYKGAAFLVRGGERRRAPPKEDDILEDTYINKNK